MSDLRSALRGLREAQTSVIDKFLADRGTHLAAMIAYFALLSFVPLLFIALSLLALAGQPSETSYLIEQLRHAFPASSIDRLILVVEEVQGRAAALSIVGAIGLFWGALGFFSVLESAFNIVYGLTNRSFLRQKAVVLVLTIVSLAVLFAALLAASLGVDLIEDAGFAGAALAYVYALAFSTALVLGFVWGMYRLLTNAKPDLTWRETFPGAAVAAVLFQASFQVLPVFVRATQELYALQAFGALVLLLVWLYVMANILVLGAELNWWLARRPRQAGRRP